MLGLNMYYLTKHEWMDYEMNEIYRMNENLKPDEVVSNSL